MLRKDATEQGFDTASALSILIRDPLAAGVIAPVAIFVVSALFSSCFLTAYNMSVIAGLPSSAL